MKANQDNLLVSVILTTYNREALLRKTIDSILAQTHSHLELIVVDNCSDYDFLSFINSFDDSRIRPFQNSNHGNFAINRNLGIRKAKGGFLAFCDDDDYWTPDKLSTQLSHFEDGVFCVGTNAHLIGAKDGLKFPDNEKDLWLDLEDALDIRRVIYSSLMVRPMAVFFDERDDLKHYEDFDYKLQYLIRTKKPLKLLSKPLVYYRLHAQMQSNSRRLENGLALLKKYDTFLPKKAAARLYYRDYYNLAWFHLGNGRMNRKYLFLALRKADYLKKIKVFGLILLSVLPGSIKTRYLQ